MANFIIDCKSVYHGDQDIIQVLAIISDEAGNSLHAAIDQAKVSLLLNRVEQDTIWFGQEAYVIPVERHESGEGWNVKEDELGEFRLFFHHYPRSQQLDTELWVKLVDGREARAIRPIGFERDEENRDRLHNPLLSGRADPSWVKERIRDFERPQ